jgi:hypothetical protein
MDIAKIVSQNCLKKKMKKMNEQEAIKFLKEKGYVVYSEQQQDRMNAIYNENEEIYLSEELQYYLDFFYLEK